MVQMVISIAIQQVEQLLMEVIFTYKLVLLITTTTQLISITDTLVVIIITLEVIIYQEITGVLLIVEL